MYGDLAAFSFVYFVRRMDGLGAFSFFSTRELFGFLMVTRAPVCYHLVGINPWGVIYKLTNRLSIYSVGSHWSYLSFPEIPTPNLIKPIG